MVAAAAKEVSMEVAEPMVEGAVVKEAEAI